MDDVTVIVPPVVSLVGGTSLPSPNCAWPVAVQLVVDDTSPEIVYSPFGDTFSTPDLLAGWNPYYSSSGFASVQGQVGNLRFQLRSERTPVRRP